MHEKRSKVNKYVEHIVELEQPTKRGKPEDCKILRNSKKVFYPRLPLCKNIEERRLTEEEKKFRRNFTEFLSEYLVPNCRRLDQLYKKFLIEEITKYGSGKCMELLLYLMKELRRIEYIYQEWGKSII